jgi:hypothetical protein
MSAPQKQPPPTWALAALAFTILIWGLTPVLVRNLTVTLGPVDFLVVRLLSH